MCKVYDFNWPKSLVFAKYIALIICVVIVNCTTLIKLETEKQSVVAVGKLFIHLNKRCQFPQTR